MAMCAYARLQSTTESWSSRQTTKLIWCWPFCTSTQGTLCTSGWEVRTKGFFPYQNSCIGLHVVHMDCKARRLYLYRLYFSVLNKFCIICKFIFVNITWWRIRSWGELFGTQLRNHIKTDCRSWEVKRIWCCPSVSLCRHLRKTCLIVLGQNCENVMLKNIIFITCIQVQM